DGIVLEPAIEINAPPLLPTKAGAYSVQATDAGGRELFNLSFDGDPVDHAPNVRQFAFVVPLSATGARPAALRLAANGRSIIRRSASLAAGGGISTAPVASANFSRVSGSRSRLR